MRNSNPGKGKRGFSSIVGSVFMVLIMSVLASGYFVYTLSQNTAYNTAVSQRNQLDQSVRSENLKCLTTKYTTFSNTSVNINASIQNVGSISVNFITLWLCASNNTWTGYNFKTLTSMTVQPGNVSSLYVNLAIEELNSNITYSYSSWLVTSNGNTVALQTQTITNNVIVAQVAQGIGSIAFNFDKFWHYEFSNTPADGTALSSISPKNYTIPGSKYLVFHVTVSDMDPGGQDINLNGNSSIYIIGQHSGTVKYATWNLVNVTNNKIYPSSTASASLAFAQPVDLYFSGQISGAQIDANNAYPLNIMFCGTKGSNDFGQNIPFVSIYLVP